MDFGDILDQWENEKKEGRKKNGNHVMDSLLEKYIPEKDTIVRKEITEDIHPGEKRNKLLRMKVERTIDLHGHTVAEAIERLNSFMEQCRKDGVRKVLIIHGKGNHSRKAPILAKKVLHFIQKSPLAGEYGTASKELGGKGALWVIIRGGKKSH